MSVRTIVAVCAAVSLSGCAGSPDGSSAALPDTLASQGYDAYNRGEYRSAVTYFEDALAIEPDNAFAIKGLEASRDSVLYFGDSRPMGRDIETRKAIYRVSLQGYEAYARGDMADAAARFRAILAVAPGDAYALKGLEAIDRRIAARGTVEPVQTAYADITETLLYSEEPGAVATVVYDPAPVTYDPAPVAVSVTAQDGQYVSIGSYDSYVASTDGTATIDVAAQYVVEALPGAEYGQGFGDPVTLSPGIGLVDYVLPAEGIVVYPDN